MSHDSVLPLEVLLQSCVVKLGLAPNLIYKSAEQKYVVRTKKRSKKRRGRQAARAAVSSGIGSAALTAAFNMGRKGSIKAGLTTGAVIAPVIGAISYLTQSLEI